MRREPNARSSGGGAIEPYRAGDVSRLVIRKATAADSDMLAILADARAIYRKMIAAATGLFSHRNCLAAQSNGRVAGLANAFPARVIENEIDGARGAFGSADPIERSAKLSAQQHSGGPGLAQERYRRSPGRGRHRGGEATRFSIDHAPRLGRQRARDRLLPSARIPERPPGKHTVASRTSSRRRKPPFQIEPEMIIETALFGPFVAATAAETERECDRPEGSR